MSQPLSVTASTVADVLSPGVEKAGACIRKRIDSCEHRSLDLESPRAACGRSRLLVWKKFLGDPYLLEWINRFKPDLVLSGHVHNARFIPKVRGSIASVTPGSSIRVEIRLIKPSGDVLGPFKASVQGREIYFFEVRHPVSTGDKVVR